MKTKIFFSLLSVILIAIFSCKTPVEQTDNKVGPVPFDTAFTPADINVRYLTMKTLEISWMDTSTKNIKGFILDRSINGFEFEIIATVNDTVYSFIDTIKQFGYYAYSIRTVTSTDTSWPKAYYGIDAEDFVPGNVSLQRVNSALLQLRWQDRFPYQHRFIIERKVGPGEFSFLTLRDSGVTSLTETIAGYQSYQYRIAAFDGIDTTRRIVSNAYSVNDPIPTELTVDYFDQEVLQVSWKEEIPFETGFVIEKSIDNAPYVALRTVGANVTSLYDTATSLSKLKYRISAEANSTVSSSIESNEIIITNWLWGRPFESQYCGLLPIQLKNGDILLFCHHRTQQYNYLSRQWETKGDMAANAMTGVPMLLQNGNILSLRGGIGMETPGGLTGVVNETFDPSTGMWQTVSSLHADLTKETSFVPVLSSDGIVYIIGMVGNLQYNATQSTPFAEKFSPVSGTFTNISPLNQTVLSNAGVFLSAGKILLTGGIIWKGLVPGPQTFTDSCYLYDIASDKWSRGPKMSALRSGHFSFSLNNGNGAIVLGGRSTEIYGSELSTYQLFNAQTLTWQPAQNLPEQSVEVVGATKVSEDTLLVILSGLYNDSRSFYRYIHSSDSWEKIGSVTIQTMQYPRYLTRLPNGRYIVFGGGDSRPLFYVPELR